ncbi:VOC family protein [Flavobacterium sp. ST-87]|uniref:VOC family protein n=1 Tax=Flavobacterium plantiphilum TaxID=3163297 RepID=A0ABW8XVH6_9FLAO
MKLRIARHTNNLEQINFFYTKILEFELLGSFENHSNYNGIFIGKPNLDWHLEFTQSDDQVTHLFDEDDILVLYPETVLEYDTLIAKVSENNINFINAKNPYWNKNGKMFLDPDGARIVISNLKSKQTINIH